MGRQCGGATRLAEGSASLGYVIPAAKAPPKP